MKYFTKEIWLGLQDEKKRRYYEKILRKNVKLYKMSINKLRSKFPKRTFDFFSQHHCQGEYILDINITNSGKAYIQKETKEAQLINSSIRLVNFKITTLCPTKKFYLLHYKDVKRYIIDYPSTRPLWFEGKGGHGSWAYDELSCIGSNGIFKHEILLHSGATIMIEFKTFNYSYIEIKSSRLKGDIQKILKHSF